MLVVFSGDTYFQTSPIFPSVRIVSLWAHVHPWNISLEYECCFLEINLGIISFCEHLFVGRISNRCFLSIDVYGLMLKSAAECCTLFPFFSLVFQFHVCATFFEFLSISCSWIYALDSIQIFQLPLSQIRVVYIKFWACCSGFTTRILRYCAYCHLLGLLTKLQK